LKQRFSDFDTSGTVRIVTNIEDPILKFDYTHINHQFLCTDYYLFIKY